MRISLRQQIDEVEYELEQRAKVYPNIARSNPSRQSELAYHEDRMRAVLGTLRWLAEHELLIKQRLAY
jgi:hypothetical protein